MKKINKKALIYIISIIVVFLLITFIYINPSLYSKDTSIIETLRTVYYSNFDLFPDFLFNLGNGQNIYYLASSYLLSPITIISYLFPFLSIKVYLSIIISLSSIISIILVYKYFIYKHYSRETSFLVSLVYMILSVISYLIYSPLLSSYFLFLIMSIYGVDKVFSKKKGYLLTISVFLMIMTNYKESISGIICILIYSLYRYLKHMNTITIKSLFKRFISIIVPILVSLLCSSVLLIPTIISLSNTPNIKSISNLSPSLFLLCLLFLFIPSLINYLKKDKTNLTLSIIIVILIIINTLTNYSLISYIPLFLIIIGNFLSNLLKKNLNITKLTVSLIIISIIMLLFINQLHTLIQVLLLILFIFIYYKYSNKNILIILVSLLILINPFLIKSNSNNISLNEVNPSIPRLLSSIKDNQLYRTYIEEVNKNTIYNNINCYSSLLDTPNSNVLYQELNQNIFSNNENQDNLISLLLNNNKYLISSSNPLHGYKQLRSISNLKLYKNENTFPIGFASSNIMSYEDFSKLNSQIKQEALLNVIVADTESNNSFIPTTKKINFSLEEIFNQENIITKEDSLFINAQDPIKVEYQLPEKYQNKILFIKFNVQNSRPNQIIKINDQEKKLSKSSHTLEYMLAKSNQSHLVFTFTAGQYYLDNFEFYLLDYANIENCSQKVDPFIIEPENTKGDKIIGTIEVSKNSYFMLTIPYDNGFKILVDNQVVEYEKVDETYIGFPIKEGLHSIEIIYQVPYKNTAYLLSILGIISFIIITYFESKRQFN